TRVGLLRLDGHRAGGRLRCHHGHAPAAAPHDDARQRPLRVTMASAAVRAGARGRGADTPQNRTTSMILGQRCSNTSPFDPGSWKAPLRPPLDSYTRHGIIRRIRVPGDAIVRKKDLIKA